MIIDFHTHAFPDAIAEKTVKYLKGNSKTEAFSDGTVKGLSETAKRAGIDLSVVLPVVTNPASTEKINLSSAKINEKTFETGVFSFGGIHPDTQDYKGALKLIKELGLKGVKIHPAYQQVSLNDIRYKRIIGYAEELGLIIVCHGGLDIGIAGNWSTPQKALEILEEVKPTRLVMAHLGGWGLWKDVKKYLVHKNVYLDTAFCLLDFAYQDTVPKDKRYEVMPESEFIDIVREHGADKILFGTDSPWSERKAQVEFIKNCALEREEKRDILGANAEKLLRLR